ncbi:MAG: hypothetical protein AB2L14_24155 [Candidatus Xenobiia bacterium LiM19]
MTEYFSLISSQYNSPHHISLEESTLLKSKKTLREEKVEDSLLCQVENIPQETRLELQNFYNKTAGDIDKVRHPILFPNLEEKTGDALSQDSDLREEKKLQGPDFNNELAMNKEKRSKNTEQALSIIKKHSPEVAKSIESGEFRLYETRDIPNDEFGRESMGTIDLPENPGGEITIKINPGDKEYKNNIFTGKWIAREPLDVAEDIVHEYYHAKMARELGITKKEYNKLSLNKFFDATGDALCYRKGNEFKDACGGTKKASHIKDQREREEFVKYLEILINKQNIVTSDPLKQKHFDAVKQLYANLGDNEKKRVKECLNYYKKMVSPGAGMVQA